MTRFTTNIVAAFAAVFLTISAIGTIIAVPPVHAQVDAPYPGSVELA